MSKFDTPNGQQIRTKVNNEDLYRRWIIAATEGAFSDWHADAAGYGTFVHMWAGIKIWCLANPEAQDEHDLIAVMDPEKVEKGAMMQTVPLVLLPGDDL